MRDSEALQYGKGSFRDGEEGVVVKSLLLLLKLIMLFDESVFWCSSTFTRFPKRPSEAGHS